MNTNNKRKMKKNLVLAMAALAFVACSNEEERVLEYGQVTLGVDVKNEIVVNTRAAATAEELADYTIAIYQGDAVKLSATKYSALPSQLLYPAGSGYVVYAEDCTEAVAQSANDGWGQKRIAGNSEAFTIVANQNNQVAFDCTVQNALVGVNYLSSFTDTFTEYSVEVNESSDTDRKLTFPTAATFASHTAYFNIDSTPEISYVIKGKFNGVDKTYTGTLAIAAAKHYKLNLSSTSKGQITLSITIDNTVTEESQDVTVNPYVR